MPLLCQLGRHDLGVEANLWRKQPLPRPFSKLPRPRVHTAVETAGHVPWGSFEQILPYTDLFLYDLKHMDPGPSSMDRSRQPLILSNLERLSQRTGYIICAPRLSPASMITKLTLPPLPAKAGFLALMNSHLLPFHRFGEGNIDCWTGAFPTGAQ